MACLSPWGRSRDRMRSCGFSSAVYTCVKVEHARRQPQEESGECKGRCMRRLGPHWTHACQPRPSTVPALPATEQEPAWKLAGEPDRDCTFTPHSAGSRRKAARARFCDRVGGMSVMEGGVMLQQTAVGQRLGGPHPHQRSPSPAHLPRRARSGQKRHHTCCPSTQLHT